MKILKVIRYTFYSVAIVLSLFQLWMASYGVLSQYQLRGTHLGLVLVLIYLEMILKSIETNKIRWTRLIIGSVGFVLSFITASYVVIMDQELFYRAGDPTSLEILFGIIMVLLVLEATRYVMGWVLPIIAMIAILYAYLGPYMPSIIAHKGYSTERLVSQLYMGAEGIFGSPIAATATFVAIFVIFGAFLLRSGAGEVFVDLAFSLFGKVRGGPAKMSVVSSSLFGMVSGSPVANVVSTGSLSIPLMKKNGYKPHVAGAIEASASTGGQIVPPVLGAAAFLMAEVTGMPYLEIVKASVIPAIVYYIAIFIMVDFEAAKTGIKGIKKELLPRFFQVIKKGWNLLLPIVVLLYVLVIEKMSPMKSAFYSIIAVVLFSLLQRRTRMKLIEIVKALIEGSKNMLEVVAACATAGIVIGILNLTGLGLKFSTILVTLSGGNLVILLILAAVASIILGMGLPAVGVYLILSVLVVPALVELDVSVISAHFFIMYFGILSAITPPVALAGFAASGIAKSNAMLTSFTAVKFAIAAYIFPFVFVMDPTLLTWDGSVINLIIKVLTAILGVIGLAIAVQGYPLHGKFKIPQRILAFIASIALIIPILMISLIGLVILSILLVPQLTFLLRTHYKLSA